MFVNLTPHSIMLPTGKVVKPSGLVRCSEVVTPLGKHEDVPLMRRRYGHVDNLPDPQENVIYIVSTIVRLAHPERTDLASPGELERDGMGNVLMTRTLIVN